MESILQILTRELGKQPKHIENVITLIDEGNTIPFIARYRKELHGTMDDTTLRTLADRLQYLRNLQTRRDEVKSAIEAQGKLTEELSAAIDGAVTLAEVEDLYRPYKQKRRTRATVAREKGLEPLALSIFAQEKNSPTPETLAAEYLSEEKEVKTIEDALAGASDIIAEMVSDSAEIRKALRVDMLKNALIQSKAAKEEDSVYRLYYDFSQPAAKLQGYQTLAINRGEKEEFLKVSLVYPEADGQRIVKADTVKPHSPCTDFVAAACDDAYTRLIYPSMEREIRAHFSDLAAESAIRNFAINLKPLLMQPPVKGKVTLGFDPAYRTGCKLAVVDKTGKVLDTAVIYPTPPHNKTEEAKLVLKKLISKHGISHIAIGNGTASRESEAFVAALLPELSEKVSYMVVSEAGASVYSASELGAAEFPTFDVSLRSAVSIARRLQDPLAELVKIDPKSIGVGQYQHDVPQNRLAQTLDGVVEDCVNRVGVDLNTASPSLLARVAGLNQTTAKNIVAYRDENGIFTSRKQLLKVPKLGQKAFLQCAGFIRVAESKQPLDNTAVHPESYAAAETLITLCGYSIDDIQKGNLKDLAEKVQTLGEQKAADACGVGLPTLQDLVRELTKPGRDPRDELPPPLLRTAAMEIKDLSPGMVLDGTVRNLTDFGAFVDIGVHQDGLVHISQICNRFIRHPSEALSVGDVIKVVVLEADAVRKRIGLSIRQVPKQENTNETI